MDRLSQELPSRHIPTCYCPFSPTPVDLEIRSLGGITIALDMMPESVQAAKAPMLMQERIVELSRETGRLRKKIIYFRSVMEDVSLLLCVLSHYIHGLSSVVRKCNIIIDGANAHWLRGKDGILAEDNPFME